MAIVVKGIITGFVGVVEFGGGAKVNMIGLTLFIPIIIIAHCNPKSTIDNTIMCHDGLVLVMGFDNGINFLNGLLVLGNAHAQ